MNVRFYLNFFFLCRVNIPQSDDRDGEEDREIVDDAGDEGDADATDAKRKNKQEEEVPRWMKHFDFTLDCYSSNCIVCTCKHSCPYYAGMF